MYWTGISPFAIALQAIGLGLLVFFVSLIARSRGKKHNNLAQSKLDAHLNLLENRQTPAFNNDQTRLEKDDA